MNNHYHYNWLTVRHWFLGLLKPTYNLVCALIELILLHAADVLQLRN